MTDRMELLARWSEIAPSECDIRPDPVSEDVHEVITFAARGRSMYITDSPYFEAVLLSALIEAVRARGWHYTLESYQSDDGIWHSALAIWECGNHHARKRAYAAEPCDALLSAYVAALEATKEELHS